MESRYQNSEAQFRKEITLSNILPPITALTDSML